MRFLSASQHLFRSSLCGCLLLLFLSGCETTNAGPDLGPHVGSGDIVLWPIAMANLEEFLASPTPGVFAVSLGGWWIGQAPCPDGVCTEAEAQAAIRQCKRKSNEPVCKVLIQGRNLVWRGKVAYRPKYLFGKTHYPRDLPVSLVWRGAEPSDTDRRPIDGNRARYWGHAHFHPNGDIILSFWPSIANGYCVGSVTNRTATQGDFGFYCTERDTASGTISLAGSGYGGGHGETTDAAGNRVEVKIIPPSGLRDGSITAQRDH